jgi:rubrerythrin
MNAQARLEDFIGTIVRDPQLHARWLNTFSFLEYVGFRKIVKSQKAETLSATVLNHAVEEGRHALRLKKLAIALGGRAFETYAPETLICGAAAEDYFQSLDRECEAQFADRNESERGKLTYLYVTWLVERRALEVYGLYKRAVAGTQIAQQLEGLLAEETGHLRQVESEIAASDAQHVARAAKVIALEAHLYAAFLDTLASALASEAAAA